MDIALAALYFGQEDMVIGGLKTGTGGAVALQCFGDFSLLSIVVSQCRACGAMNDLSEEDNHGQTLFFCGLDEDLRLFEDGLPIAAELIDHCT